MGDFVSNLRYEVAARIWDNVETIDLIPMQLDVANQGKSYIFNGWVTELRRSWHADSNIYLLHLTIEDFITDLEVVFPSAYLRRVMSAVVGPDEMEDVEYIPLLNRIGESPYRVLVTFGPWNNVENRLDLFLVKLFPILDD
ncbi:unnamed protein product [Linum tenue]|uniref:Uncharacterized protein n=1 Tax=Linum tenue TaxID=586396 RepID=A0AAV0QQG4_9ROSI|nr:unnamed protein product [Linum tenue]